jgi:protein TonB
MKVRLPLAFLVALLLHSAAGVWLGKMLASAAPSQPLAAASLLEVELSAPPEPEPPDTSIPDETPPAPQEPESEPLPPPEPPEPEAPLPPPPPPPPVKSLNPPPVPVPAKPAKPRPPTLRPIAKPAAASSEKPRAKPAAATNSRQGSANSTNPSARPSGPAGPSTGPVCISRPAPAYPAALLNRRIGGTVAVEVGIDANGRVSSTSLAGSSGQAALDQAALNGVRRWRFKPAMKLGVPIAAHARVNVVFRPQ